MDQLIDLYQQTKVAQRRAEQAGCLSTAAALSQIADMMAQEASRDGATILPIATHVTTLPSSALPVDRQA